jgi:hypothetical protein
MMFPVPERIKLDRKAEGGDLRHAVSFFDTEWVEYVTPISLMEFDLKYHILPIILETGGACRIPVTTTFRARQNMI